MKLRTSKKMPRWFSLSLDLVNVTLEFQPSAPPGDLTRWMTLGSVWECKEEAAEDKSEPPDQLETSQEGAEPRDKGEEEAAGGKVACEGLAHEAAEQERHGGSGDFQLGTARDNPGVPRVLRSHALLDEGAKPAAALWPVPEARTPPRLPHPRASESDGLGRDPPTLSPRHRPALTDWPTPPSPKRGSEAQEVGSIQSIKKK